MALALVPGAMLLPGCGGGGGGSSAPTLAFGRQRAVEFLNFQDISGILSVNFADSAGDTARAAGTLRVFNNSTPNRPASVAAGNGDLVVGLAPGSYVLSGNVIRISPGAYRLEMRGSYPDGPAFTLTGGFQEGDQIAIDAKFNTGNSSLVGRLSRLDATPTPVATNIGNTPVPGTTPLGTATPVGTTTPIATGTPLGGATPFGTATPLATGTPLGGATPVFTATAISPTPVGAGGGTTDPPRVP